MKNGDSEKLTAYLTLERSLTVLHGIGEDGVAEKLMDIMFPVWLELTDKERESLNSRELMVRTSFMYD